MEEKTPQHPEPRELVIPDDEVYACTNLGTYQVIEFLLTKLEPVPLEDLVEDQDCCAICQMEFCVSENEKLSHPPVRTVCRHIFGKYCIIKWLDPLSYWGKAESAECLLSEMDTELEDTKTSCPTCRKAFFPTTVSRSETMFELLRRLRLWDRVYELSGITRSEREEYSRKYLWEFVNYCRSVNEFKLTRDLKMKVVCSGQFDLWHHTAWLKTQALTLVQKKLRKKLAELAVSGLEALIDQGFEIEFVPHQDPRAYKSDEEDEDGDDRTRDEQGFAIEYGPGASDEGGEHGQGEHTHDEHA